MCPIFLVTNIIITLNAINYFAKTLLQIFDRIVSPSLHFKERKVLLLNFRGLCTNQYPCFFINILGVLGNLQLEKKNRKATKK